eukprot:TRINITY_DN44246_c0_g1_i1.p1 TRINITY_DN44246_c0_g1~~TRINITY_DN44246_c0_g1_i1.p1  ORF type:complete len:212 (-),score=38.41 TRINITY_DN44246_c0_g1_i1:65-646(-)
MGASGSADGDWLFCRPCSRDDCHEAWPSGMSAPSRGLGPPVAASSTSCNSVLLRGARDGDPTLVREALDAGASTETRAIASSVAKTGRMESALGLTALMHAARGGHLTCVMALLDSRAALDAEDEEGATPLHYAAASGDLDVFKALILAGADASVTDTKSRGPLDYLPIKIQNDVELQKSWRAVLRNELPYGV